MDRIRISMNASNDILFLFNSLSVLVRDTPGTHSSETSAVNLRDRAGAASAHLSGVTQPVP